MRSESWYSQGGEMILKNFEVSGSIELQSGALFWDLHNFAKFDGLELLPSDDAVVMRWSVPIKPNPWGCPQNKFKGMELIFRDLLFLRLGPRDDELPMTEDGCVAEIFKVDPKFQTDEPYMRQILHVDDSFRLAFQFQGGRVIEIESVTVELVPKS